MSILRFSRKSLLNSGALIAFLIAIAVLYGLRTPENHSDSARYASYFLSLGEVGYNLAYEPLFFFLTKAVAELSDSVAVYFIVLILLYRLFYYWLATRCAIVFGFDRNKLLWFYGFLVGFQLLSNWHYVLSVDAIKQGLAIPFIIMALLAMQQHQRLYSLIFLLVATSLHFSTILLLPFLLVVIMPLSLLRISFLVFSGLYITQLNSDLVLALQQFTSIPIYDRILAFAYGSNKYYGFDLRFLLYSLFLCFLSEFVLYHNSKYRPVHKVVLVFAMFFFIFAFANFTNRYAFYLWSTGPLIMASFVSTVYFKANHILFYVLLMLGLCKSSLVLIR